mgnify:CR=1 FL=1
MPNDYILRSDVEKMIKKQDLYWFWWTNFVHYDELLESISSIQSVDRWIPVSERLPEWDEEFIVYDINDDIVTTANFSTDTWKFDLPFWKVTKWQYLPPNPPSHDK